MEREKWMERLVKELKKKMGEEYQIVPLPDEKNPKVGIRKAGDTIGFSVSLDDGSPNWINSEESVEKAACFMQETYKKIKESLTEDICGESSYAEAENGIVYALENLEWNKSSLPYVPYRIFLDLAQVFELHVLTETTGQRRVITNEDLKQWKIGIGELVKAAEKNTPALYPPYICLLENAMKEEIENKQEISFEQMLERMRAEKDTDIPVFVLSSSSGRFGANCLLYEGVLERIANVLEDDLIILPSSRDELLLLADNKTGGDIDAWQLMLLQMNMSENLKESAISDSVYRYDWKHKELVIATKRNPTHGWIS